MPTNKNYSAMFRRLAIIASLILILIVAVIYWKSSPHGHSEYDNIIGAVRFGSVEDVRFFIDQGVDVNMIDNNDDLKRMPLHLAASDNSNVDVVKYLISEGANVNAEDDSGMTPLHWAIVGNANIDVIKCPIEQGADIHAKSSSGKTPFDIANTEEKKSVLSEAGGKSGNEQ